MAEIDWNTIKLEYITENTSYRRLAEKYGISLTALRYKGRNEGWVAAKEQHNHNLTTNAVKSVEKNAAKYKFQLYELAVKVAKQMANLTDDYTLRELCGMGIKPRDITGALKDLEDVLHVKSTADIEEQRARINKLKKDAESDSNEPKKITISIEGGEDKWSQ